MCNSYTSKVLPNRVSLWIKQRIIWNSVFPQLFMCSRSTFLSLQSLRQRADPSMHLFVSKFECTTFNISSPVTFLIFLYSELIFFPAFLFRNSNCAGIWQFLTWVHSSIWNKLLLDTITIWIIWHINIFTRIICECHFFHLFCFTGL